MDRLPKLKGWSRKKVEAAKASSARSASPDLSLSFPLLSELRIKGCKELSSFPLCPCVRRLAIKDGDYGLLQQLLSTTSTSNSTSPSSLEELFIAGWQWLVSFPTESLSSRIPTISLSSLKIRCIDECQSLENLSLRVSPLLKVLEIRNCDGLTSVEVEALPSLASLVITDCRKLKSVRIARLNALRELKMWGCPKELELWGIQQQNRIFNMWECPEELEWLAIQQGGIQRWEIRKEKLCVDWDSLPNLSELVIRELPCPEELPDCLLHRQALGQVQIRPRHQDDLVNRYYI